MGGRGEGGGQYFSFSLCYFFYSDARDGAGESSSTSSKPEQPSVISVSLPPPLMACCNCLLLDFSKGAKWSVDEVCQWAESVAKQQNAGGGTHPDDVRAGVFVCVCAQLVCVLAVVGG